jgi:hypothetical protein
MPRTVPLVLGAVLLVIIGLSGLAAGVTIVAAMTSAAAPPVVGLEIGFGIAIYGLLATGSAIGVFLRRRAWWSTGIATIVAGLVVLFGLAVAVGPDPMFGSGIAIWGVTLACLLAPPTRRALGGQPD